jgi:hypothetical protein
MIVAMVETWMLIVRKTKKELTWVLNPKLLNETTSKNGCDELLK